MDRAGKRAAALSLLLIDHGEKVTLGSPEKEFLMYTLTDKAMTCADCSSEFIFSASEQEFYADRQFSEPRRCPSCRATRKLSRGGSGDPARSGGSYGESRPMFAATCSSCGREAKVPFQPTGSKPVYCSECFTSQRQSYR